MADHEKSTLEVLLTCPVCHDIFKEPRQLPCGHSICKVCLDTMIDHSTDMPFRCADCRAYFGRVIEIQKNYALANIVEDYWENNKEKVKQEQNVYCDCCPDRAVLAAKTCLKCEVSLCAEHVRDHHSLPAYTGHPLVTPLGDLAMRKCPQHRDEVLRYYCNSSRRYICNICSLETKLKNVATESSSILSHMLTEKMEQRFQSFDNNIMESNEAVKKLKEYMLNEKRKANSNYSFLNSVTVTLLFLWLVVLYYAYSYSMDNQKLSETLIEQQHHLHDIYSSIAEYLGEHSSQSHSYTASQNEGFSRVPLTFNLNTVSPYLGLSVDLASVERTATRLGYPSSQARFDDVPQVLSTLCFSTGTHSWEVEPEGCWTIAVSSKAIQRKGKAKSVFGHNAVSWSVTYSEEDESKPFACHDGIKEVLPPLKYKRIAATVDFENGTITFSEVGPMKCFQLHRFQAKPTEPVCLGLALFCVDTPSRASIVKVT